MSVLFAAALSMCTTGIIQIPHLAEFLVGFLLVFFGIRFIKGRKIYACRINAGLVRGGFGGAASAALMAARLLSKKGLLNRH